VKDPLQMYKLWNATTGTNFHDFSRVFTHDGGIGWTMLLEELKTREKICPRLNDTSLNVVSVDNGTVSYTEAPECFKWRRRKLRQDREVKLALYGPHYGSNSGSKGARRLSQDRFRPQQDADSYPDPGPDAFFEEIIQALSLAKKKR
jgi:hypothetical protein